MRTRLPILNRSPPIAAWCLLYAATIGLLLHAPAIGQLTAYKDSVSLVPSSGRVLPTAESGNNSPFGGSADYDDLVPLPTSFSNVAVGVLPGFQSADIVNVVWLHEEEKAAAFSASLLSPVAEPVRTLVYQETGVLGGSMGPYAETTTEEAIGLLPDRMPLSQHAWPNTVGIIYGIRILTSSDLYVIRGDGGVLGKSRWDTNAENRIVGPQLGMVLLQNRGPWSLRLQGTALAAYNGSYAAQDGFIGEDLTPGRHNHPLYLRPSRFSHEDARGRFSPGVELIAQTSLRLTAASALRVAWSGVYVDNAVFTDDRIVLGLPSMGLRDPGNQSLFVRNFYCGIEFVR